MPDFDEHSDDALHLSALGRSEPPRTGPDRERCAMPQRHHHAWDVVSRANFDWASLLLSEVQNEQRRIARRWYWKRTAATFGWLALVLAAAALLIIGSWS